MNDEKVIKSKFQLVELENLNFTMRCQRILTRILSNVKAV